MSPPVSGAAISGRSRPLIITQQPPAHPPGDDHEGSPSALSRPGFRYGRRIVARLNSMHTTAGPSTVALLLVAAPTISTVLVALCILYAMWSRPGRRSTGLLPTAEIMYSGIPLAQGVIVVALAIAGTVMFRSASTPRILLRGLAPAIAVTLAFARYNMMTAGAVQGLADRLGNYGEPGTGSGPLAGPRPSGPAPPTLRTAQLLGAGRPRPHPADVDVVPVDGAVGSW
ncbi:hypothetical protein [Streptomyces anulatus]|uniref:hypothetical protein n=1 Tax=Streptomyces anulatus TaxID=1892 RepID=UPI003652DC0E